MVGIENGGTSKNGTVRDSRGHFLVETMAELPSLVREGPDKAIGALVDTVDKVLAMTGIPRELVRAVGLDTPGPASAAGVLASKGATNFGHVAWGGFDIRRALEERLGIPVVYNNDANAAALYAHHVKYGDAAARYDSVAAIVGTGLGGGVVVNGQVVSGAAGMAGELGHFPIRMDDLLEEGQLMPACNCGLFWGAESGGPPTRVQANFAPLLMRPV